MKEEQDKKQLPKGWKWGKLGEECKVVTGTTPSKSDLANYGNDIPFFKPPHLWDGVITDTQEKLSLKGATMSRIVPANTVLVTCIGNLGRTGFVKKKAAFNQQINAILENENIIGKYIFYQAQSPLFKKQLEKLATGTTVSIVNKGNFETIEIPVPPKPTQQAIVSKIEELFSELDKGIEQLKIAQQQLKIYRQAVLKWAFFNERFIRYKIKDVAEKIQIGPFGTQLHREDYIENGIPLINPMHIKDGNIIPDSSYSIKDEKRNSLPNYILREGDVIMGRRGEMGRCGLVSKKEEGWFCGTGSLYFRPNSGKVNSTFLYYYLRSQPVKQYLDENAGGTTMANLNLKIVNEIPISLPSLKEQHEIILEIESRVSVADKMEEAITQGLQQAETLRQSILKMAFEGRLVATDTIETIKQSAKVIPTERKILAGEIIHLLHKDKNFGLTKFQKTLHIIENFVEVTYETNFIRERAGPYDKEFTTIFRKEMQEKDWVQEEQKGSTTRFVPGNNIGALIKDYTIYFKEKNKQVEFVIEQLKDKSTHEAELIATLYAVWNNRLIKKQPAKIELLAEDFFKWSSKKKEEFQEEEVISTYKWMKKIKLVPKGFGKAIESEA